MDLQAQARKINRKPNLIGYHYLMRIPSNFDRNIWELGRPAWNLESNILPWPEILRRRKATRPRGGDGAAVAREEAAGGAVGRAGGGRDAVLRQAHELHTARRGGDALPGGAEPVTRKLNSVMIPASTSCGARCWRRTGRRHCAASARARLDRTLHPPAAAATQQQQEQQQQHQQSDGVDEGVPEGRGSETGRRQRQV